MIVLNVANNVRNTCCSVIGTSSLRRAAQLRRNFPSLRLKDIVSNLSCTLECFREAMLCHAEKFLVLSLNLPCTVILYFLLQEFKATFPYVRKRNS